MLDGRLVLFSEVKPSVEGDGVFLREPRMADYKEWAQLRSQSRAFLEPWEPRWARDELTRSAYRARIRFYYRDARQDHGYAFFVFRSSDERLMGGMTLSNVRRGVSQSCSLGYWIGQPYARQGYMTKAVQAASWFVFNILRLNRLEAACLPQNTASAGLLVKTGFQYEGLARRYLKINGVWQDHWLFARLNSDHPPL
jgi:ribosomal-protein-alanine N-acetyltransferase